MLFFFSLPIYSCIFRPGESDRETKLRLSRRFLTILNIEIAMDESPNIPCPPSAMKKLFGFLVDPDQFHRRIGKKWTLILFNIGTLLYVVLTDDLKLDLKSIITYVLVLLVINCLLLISARQYPNWK